MRTRRHAVLRAASLIMVFAALGCSDETASTRHEAAASKRGGDTNPCGEGVRVPIAWDQVAASGVTPRAAFTMMTGSCRAELTWDASSANTTHVEPRQGKSALEVQVVFDESSARELTPSGSPEVCRPGLEAEADVTIASADGSFRDSARVTAVFSAVPGVVPLSVRRDLAELGGSLRIGPKPGVRTSLTYRVESLGTSCRGELTLAESGTSADGQSNWGSEGSIGTWSAGP